jgi:putative iron-dependent peroxidase
MFVGFCSEQRPLAAMLESMAGLTTGARDALTRFTRPLTGAYYFVPSIAALIAATPDTETDGSGTRVEQ